ncbi:MAG: conjugal transfer protein TraH [Mesorhizobium sp.]|uniref:TraH family protein n=1 Tax=Mesorhizobium sp. TaxID=1871066 RepID=UPI000FE5192C|nr:TraH family protein [Mesorhizobium sp.]RWC00345.1 MAG: conjugal transfer protein TraH [Mesorhizobium sp.]
MIDAALIQHCADPSLKSAIVEKFIERAGSQDPLAVTVRSGNRVVLVPKPATQDEAMDLIRQHVGRAVVRVGITQYPAGLGVVEAGELKTDLVDACANLRMGTALFAKVYRIVTKWYGTPVEEAFDDAIIAWQTGYFEGESVFRAADPGDVRVATPAAGSGALEKADSEVSSDKSSAEDPNRAGIRVDLSQIGR